YQLLGDLCHEKNQPVESVYHYRLALEQEPQNGVLLKKTGIRLFLNKDYPNALHYLEKALAQSPNDFDILYHLGRVHSERKELIRGLYFFKESALLMPENPYVHSHMGYLMFKLEDFEGAIQEYRLAVSYGEDDVWTSTVAQTLGVLYYQVRQDMDAAVAMFQLSFQLNPSNLDSMVMLADLYFEQGNLQSAVGAYQYILKHEPENAEYYSYLGYLLWQMDKNDEAIKAYEKAIHFDPESFLSFNNLGVIYLDELRENQKALGLFQKALALKSDYTLACFNMGRALENMGNAVLAANAYSTTLEMNAENPELEDQEILAKLDGLFKTQ
ncbi:MAG: tetratricopeptide repeat protein, partial [Cyanobacteria bacterium]|nr:tetratricopeptide repeat protein [Cyanobacteriota bacterium]